MSSFNNYFEEEENLKEIQFESDSFYPFLETMIILSIFYFSYKLFSSIKSQDSKYQDSEKYINCQCDYCKKRLKRIMKKNHKNKHNRIFIIILLFLFYYAKKCYDIILQNQTKIKAFDPYEILGINSLSDKSEIKKAYKHLALLYHPDKNLNDINAKNKFMLINKAYETLIDENAKKNYEIYGNPDGPSPMRISLGMPSFILNKQNHIFIITILIIIICFIIPFYFLRWYINIYNIDENGIFYRTKEIFKKATNLNFEIINVPFTLGNCEEFNLIPEPHIRAEIIQINNLYDKYKNIFKNNKEILEKIGYTLSLNKKKAIGIAFEYSFCDKTDKNYLKLHKINDYIILLSKLLNIFIDIQTDKYYQLKYLKKMKEFQNEEEKAKINKLIDSFQPIKKDLIFNLITYQQCFYKGIPLFLLHDKYIPYTQLPHISLKNYNILKDKDIDISIEQFLNYGDEGKKTIIQKIFNFNNSEISDIIESTKAIPRYEYKINTYVDGFEDTGFIKGDKITFKLNINRKNIEDKYIGVQHSKCFPGLFKEFIYVVVDNNNNLIRQNKIFINKKENEYKFQINLGSIGILPIKIILIPGTFFASNVAINCQLKCYERSQIREELIQKIENRNKKEKIEPSLVKKIFLNYQNESDDDDEEEEDEEEEKNKENNKEKIRKTYKEDINGKNYINNQNNKDIINNIEIDNEIETIEN